MLKFCFLYFRHVAGHRISPLDICTVKYLKVWNVVESWLTHLCFWNLMLVWEADQSASGNWATKFTHHTTSSWNLKFYVTYHIIPHCLKFRCTFLIFSVWPIVGNVHSMGFASWCHGLIWISLEWKNRYTICQNVCHMFDKYKKSGPHCPFTQLFDQCRDVVGI